jgi:hypothetical protein
VDDESVRRHASQGHASAAARRPRASRHRAEVVTCSAGYQQTPQYLLCCRYMVATSDSPVPAWFVAGLSMAMLRPFNEEKVKRTEEV